MIYAFDDFELDLARWELRRRGAPVDVPPKVMQTLAVLMDGGGRVVTGDELRARVWPSVVVTEASIRKSIRLARQALGGESGAGGLIKTTRGRGYRYMGKIEQRNPEPEPSPLRPSRRPPNLAGRFIGRSDEVSELIVALERADCRRSNLVLVTGEPGMGKTRLIEEFAARAQGAGARVLIGRCCEEGGAPELRPWAQVLRELLADRDASGTPAWIRREITRIAPGDDERDDALVPDDIPSEVDRFRLFEAISEFVKQAAATRTLVVALEDLHSADASTLLLLKFLAREVHEARLLLVGTYRPADAASENAVATLLGKLVREAHMVSLHGLPESEIAELIAVTSGTEPSPELVKRVREVTEGNPFFVSEVARLPVLNGPLPASFTIHIPERIVEVVRGRFDSLDPRTRELLTIASVAGREFEVALIQRVSGLEQDAVTRALEPAIERKIITVQSSDGGTCRFTHILLRDVLYDGLGITRRAELHRRVAEVFEFTQANGGAVPAALLAHHFSRAGLGAGSRRAATHAMAAGREALHSLAFEEAAGHFEQALDALRFDASEESLRSDILLSLGHARRLAGAYVRAAETFARSLQVAQGAADPRAAARAALAYAQVKPESGTVANQDVIATLEGVLPNLEALAASDPEARDLLALVLSRLATGLSLAGRVAEGEAACDRASEIARGLGRPETLAHALLSKHWLIWRAGTAAERLGIARELARLDETLSEAQLRTDARICRITDLLELGSKTELHAAISDLNTHARAVHDPMSSWSARVYESMRLILEGRFERAEQSAHDAFPIGRQVQVDNANMLYGAHIAWIRIEQGRAEEVEEPLRHLLATAPSNTIVRGMLLRVHTEMGDERRVKEGLGAFMEQGGLNLPDDWTLLPSLSHLARAAVSVGDRATAAVVHARLSPFAGVHVVLGPGLLYLGPVSLYLGLLARVLGDLDASVAFFKQADSESSRLEARPMEARANLFLAEALLARGARGDAASAATNAARALSVSREIGLRTIEDGAEAVLKALHGELGRISPSPRAS